MANGIGIELGTHLFLFTPEKTLALPPSPIREEQRNCHIYFGKYLLGVLGDAAIWSRSYFAKRHENTLLNVWVREMTRQPAYQMRHIQFLQRADAMVGFVCAARPKHYDSARAFIYSHN